MPIDLSERVVVVTGAGQGMGRIFAQALCEAGARVGVAEVDEGAGRRAAEELTAGGHTALAYTVDVRSGEQVQDMVDDLLDRFGRLDGLVNNAGVASGGLSEQVAQEEWDRVIGIMLSGVFRCSQIAARVMIPQGYGAIVNIASIAGIGGWYERACYNTAKAGVIALTQTLGIEWARHNVRVNAIAPGQVETPLNEYVFSRGLGDRQTFTNRAPMRRFAQPTEMAEAVLFLLGDESSYIAAEVLAIDGGWLAWNQMREGEHLGA